MADVILISEKGSALSCEELDNNFRAIRELQSINGTTNRFVGTTAEDMLPIIAIDTEKLTNITTDSSIQFLIHISYTIRSIEADENGNIALDESTFLPNTRVVSGADMITVNAWKDDAGNITISPQALDVPVSADENLLNITLSYFDKIYSNFADINFTIEPVLLGDDGIDALEIFPQK